MKKATIILLCLIGCVPNQTVQAPSDIYIPPMNERKIELNKIEGNFDFTYWKVAPLMEHIISSNVSNNHLIFSFDPDKEELIPNYNQDVKVEFITVGRGIQIESYYQEKMEVVSGTFCDIDSTFEYHYRGFAFLVSCFKSLSVLK